MPKSTPASERSGLTEAEAFALLERRAAKAKEPIERIVTWILARYDLDDEFAAKLLRLGMSDWALDKHNTQPRDRIMRGVPSRVDVNVVTLRGVRTEVDVVCELRYWPLGTANGLRLELATRAQLQAEIAHLHATADGVLKRADVLEAVDKEAAAAGVDVIGELPDGVLNACRERIQHGR